MPVFAQQALQHLTYHKTGSAQPNSRERVTRHIRTPQTSPYTYKCTHPPFPYPFIPTLTTPCPPHAGTRCGWRRWAFDEAEPGTAAAGSSRRVQAWRHLHCSRPSACASFGRRSQAVNATLPSMPWRCTALAVSPQGVGSSKPWQDSVLQQGALALDQPPTPSPSYGKGWLLQGSGPVANAYAMRHSTHRQSEPSNPIVGSRQVCCLQ